MTIILATLLITSFIPGNTPQEETNQATMSSRVNDTKDSPTVFKTLNLNFPKPDQKGTLNVDINRGLIDVVSHDGPGVVIEILMPPGFENSDKSSSGLSKIFAPKYDLDRHADKNQIKLDTYNQDFVLNLRIKVPPTTDLSLDSYTDGYIAVKNVTGVITTHSQHNDIRLLDVAGSATAFSRNGDLKIRFQDVAPDAKLDFESYNGAIDLSLPDDIATTTAISAGRGTYQSAFKIASIDKDTLPGPVLRKIGNNASEYQFGKINAGGIPLRIESENGLIQIRKTKRMP